MIHILVCWTLDSACHGNVMLLYSILTSHMYSDHNPKSQFDVCR